MIKVRGESMAQINDENTVDTMVSYKDGKSVRKRFFDSENGLAIIGVALIVIFICTFIAFTLLR